MLEGFITGAAKCPSQFITTAEEGDSIGVVENPDYEEWVVQDQILLGWLYNSMEADLATEFMGSETSRELWESMKSLFGVKTKSNIVFYKREFQKLQKGGMKMAECLKTTKRLTDNMALAGKLVELDDLVSQILTVLDSHEYNPVVCQINERYEISLLELQAKLLTYEKILEQMNAGIASINLGQVTPKLCRNKGVILSRKSE
ncbi:hypothetical protein UlMin_015830 [Ulmus minor]